MTTMIDRGTAGVSEPAIETPHSYAKAMLRAAAMLERAPGHADARRVLESGAAALTTLLEGDRRPDWAWFEIVLGDDACRLPEALIRAGAALRDEAALALGIATLDWIMGQGCCPSESLADACIAAHSATGESHWFARAAAARLEATRALTITPSARPQAQEAAA